MPPLDPVTYFSAEQSGGFVLVALALASFAGAAVLLRRPTTARTMAWPLLVFGLLQLGVGSVVAWRAPEQVERLQEGLRTAKAATLAAESQRMHKVNSSFNAFKITEILVIAVGAALCILMQHSRTWAPVGLGVLLESGALLVFDLVAHERALAYTSWLRDHAT